jgi:hypothetical protein
MANMSKQKTQLTESQEELIAQIKKYDYLANDLYVNGEPLTLELRKKLGFAESLEEARTRMDENKRKQEEAERQSQG